MSQNSQKAGKLPTLTLHRGLDYAVIMRPDETTDDALVQALHPNDDDIAVMTAMAGAPELVAAAKRLLEDPHGCPFCDSGKLRNPEKSHTANCAFAMTRAALAKAGA